MRQEKLHGGRPGMAAPWLLLGVFLLFAGKQWSWPLGTLASSLFILRFIRLQPLLRGLVFGWLAQALAILLIYRGTATGAFGGYALYIPVMLAAAVVIMLPFLADRLLTPVLPPLAGCLVFPVARTALEYLAAYQSPYGEWASLATDFAGWLPLAQLAAVTGIWGITFLVALCASIGNWLWQAQDRAAWYAAAGYAILVLMASGYGLVRLQQAAPAGPTVKVAGIVRPEGARLHLPGAGALFDDYLAGRLDAAGYAALHRLTRYTQDYLFGESINAARAGARIIFWAETNALVLKQDEAAFIARGQQLARQNGVYLGMAVLVINPRQAHPEEDKIILVTPAGTIAWQYFKAHPLAGEKDTLVPGSERLPVVDTPYGRLAAMICYDSDFIRFTRQAGQAATDLLFVPSNDWRAIADMRARITRYRAIENGVSLVRPTSHGLSEIVAPDGRLLAWRNYFTDPSPVLVADVPSRGRRTPYARYGDIIAWLCLGALPILAMAAIFGQVRRRRTTPMAAHKTG